MAKTSTLGSPGVEVREIDNSLRPSTSTACTAYLNGFASQGPVEEVNRVSSVEDFKNLYGEPTNAAERYFYYQAKTFFEGTGNGATLLTSRLPYGENKGNNVSTAYTVMAYPALPVITNPLYPSYSSQVTTENAKALFTLTAGEESYAPESINSTIAIAYEGECQLSIKEIKTDTDNGTVKLILKYGDKEAPSENISIVKTADNKVDFKFVIKKTMKELNDGTKVVDTTVPYGTFQFTATYDNSVEDFDDVIKGILKGTTTFGSATTEIQIGTQVSRFTVAKNYLGETNEVSSLDDVISDASFTEEGGKIYAEDVTYLIGAPVTYQVSLEEYNKIISGEKINWKNEYCCKGDIKDYESIDKAAFVVTNTVGSTLNESFEGYFIGMSDNMFVSPTDESMQRVIPFNAVNSVKVTTSTIDSVKDGKGLYDSGDETGDFSTLNEIRLGFDCEGASAGSISRILERSMTNMDISSTEYDDTLSIGLFKLNKSATDNQTLRLSYSLRERFNGAFGKKRLKSTEQASTPVSYFIEKIVGDDSNNIAVMVNPYISNKIRTDINGNLRGKVRVLGSKLIDNLEYYEDKYITTNAKAYELLIKQAGLDKKFIDGLANSDFSFLQKLDSIYPIGTYTTLSNTSKVIGNLPYKLGRALELVENDEEYTDIDLVIDGGLSTIYAYSNGHKSKGDTTGDSIFAQQGETDKQTPFVDTVIFDGIEDLRTGTSAYSEEAQKFVEDYNAVQQTFLKFCNSQASGGRGDSFFIGDILRGTVIKGKNTKVQKLFGQTLTNSTYDTTAGVKHNWSTSIYYPIKHITDGIVSSYASFYAQWFKEDDVYSGQKIWLPASAYVAASMATTDISRGPWYAAAGYNRGVITGPIDYALNPTQPQRTDLYKICINSIPKQPNAGVTILGIRTMSKKPTAFDQNTCRRTFLYMEKKLKQMLRYYMFEPNTSYTRLNIYNDIQPFMESVKKEGGIYSYAIKCD